MAKIAVIIDNMFEDVEYTKPVKSFKQAGHSIENVGLEEGKKVMGKAEKPGVPTTVEIDKAVSDASVDDYDALLIPGGYSPDKLRVDPVAVDFVRDFVRSGKPVFAICHGPQLLITAQVMAKRRVTGYKSIVQDIVNSGADYVDEPVVKDGNLITSRQPSDIPEFIDACLEKLEK